MFRIRVNFFVFTKTGIRSKERGESFMRGKLKRSRKARRLRKIHPMDLKIICRKATKHRKKRLSRKKSQRMRTGLSHLRQ